MERNSQLDGDVGRILFDCSIICISSVHIPRIACCIAIGLFSIAFPRYIFAYRQYLALHRNGVIDLSILWSDSIV